MQHAELTVDDAGCIVLKNGALPVWPKGYTVTGDAKSFAVLDADGRTVAKSDVPFSMGGGSIPDADSGWTNVGCVPDSGNIWMVGKVDTP